MRVIAGTCKGRKLKTPKTDSIRPTEDRIKENVFNILGGTFYGAHVLDLFAGTGGIGIEFLSRGAESVWFNDQGKESIDLIRNNVGLTGFTEKSTIIRADYQQTLQEIANRGETFDYIYLDPPYIERHYYGKILDFIRERGLLKEEGKVVLESPSDYDFSQWVGYNLSKQKKYGNKTIWVLQI